MAQGSRGWTPRSEPIFQLSEAQVQAFETAPGLG